MGYSTSHVENVKSRILNEANQLFRRKGFAKTSINDVMESAGLTHGGFYAHFKSKEDLFSQAMAEDLNFTLITRQLNEQPDADALEQLKHAVTYYLGFDNRDKVGNGCTMVTLCPEVARMSDKTKGNYTKSFEALIAEFESALGSRADALACIIQCVGGLTLARAVSDGELAEELLDVAKSQTYKILSHSDV